MNKYLVTGAMGFIGSHWCEHLLKQGNIVYGIDIYNKYPELLRHKNFIFIQDTITNYSMIKDYINKVDLVFHFASIAEPKQYVDNPRKVISVAGIAALNIIDLCRVAEKRIMFTSTSEIYGKNPNVPFEENDERHLGSTETNRWCYSTSKAIAEHYLFACAQTNEIDFITVRLFNVYGPRLVGRVVSNFIIKALKNEDIIITNDGKQTRSFTYVEDVINAFDLLINSNNSLNNVFNIGSKIETSILDIASMIISKSESNSKVIFQNEKEYYGKSYEDINRRTPVVDKIKNYVGWEASTSLEIGIDKTINYFKNS